MPTTRKEYALLVDLAHHPGRVILQNQLLTPVLGKWHSNDVEYLKSHPVPLPSAPGSHGPLAFGARVRDGCLY